MSERLLLATTPERSRLMAKVRQTDTSTEQAVQTMVRSMGYRFSVKAKDLPGTPDIVNRSSRWAIFVHGCFWHAHDCHLWKLPRANREFWKVKFAANQKRDKTKRGELKRQGYSVLTLWQCELKDHSRIRTKLLKFLTANKRRRESISVVEPKGRELEGVLLSHEVFNERRTVSRTITRADGSTFATRLDIPGRMSLAQDAHSVFDQAYLRSNKEVWHGPLRGSIRIADLFSGCGGLSLGAREASRAMGLQFEPVLAIDEDSASLEVYKKNFKPALAYNQDIWTLLTGEIRARLQPEEKALVNKLGTLDVLLAGPPCQGHSDLNNHTRRTDRRNKLYERVARFAEVAEPIHIIVENVPTVVHGRDRALDNTVEELIRLGYKVNTGVVNLAALGVPQHRKRHVLVASMKTSISVSQGVENHTVSEERTARWAIGDLDRRRKNGKFDSSSVLHNDNLRRIDYLMKTGKYDLPNRLRPVCHQDEHSYVSMYGRLRYDEPAQTITSGFGSPGQGRYIHPTCRRTLTPHEAARLQFLPDSFDFSAVKLRGSLANMIGNAVPMKLSYAITLELLG